MEQLPLNDAAAVRELLAGADKIRPPLEPMTTPAYLDALWQKFLAQLRRPQTSLFDDPNFRYHHWEWTGRCPPNGVRIVSAMGARMEVRRVIWLFNYGAIPEGLFPRPACGWEACVCPSHFRLRWRRQPNQKLDRRAKRGAVRAVRDGGAVAPVAAEFGVSRQRIYELVKEASESQDLLELWPTRPPRTRKP
jgi:hypothetical protein